jgi:hypothetical protein
MELSQIKILVACEESDEVRGRFESLGFDAWSCDIQPNRNPNAKHFQMDVLEVITMGWDAMIAFPPCTHLAASGSQWFAEKQKDGRQQMAIDFFMAMINAPINQIAVENPIGIMSSQYRQPDQIVQPYFFGDPFTKTTCLWLKNFPLLYHNSTPNLFDDVVTHTSKGEFIEIVDKKTGKMKKMAKWYNDAFNGPKSLRSQTRSKTFPGIAEAMAKQWSQSIIQFKTKNGSR